MRTQFLTRALLGLTCLIAYAAAAAGQVATPRDQSSFMFVALGDMPYRNPQDFPRFERLIRAINAVEPAFSLHVGDIKSANEPCTDEYFRTILSRFNQFKQALVFTPGDNEWTDCHRERAGRYNPRERLEKLREIFYATPEKSLGLQPIALESQGRTMPAHARFVENARFWKNGVLFVTVHVVGSNNGFETSNLEAASEFFDRNKANVAWLDDSFKLARTDAARAVVVAMQATPYDIKQKNPSLPSASGFVDIVRAIERGAKALDRPMLIIHGDEHEFEVEGFRDTSFNRIPKVWRLQVMGAEYVHAVRISVDPMSPHVFGFTPLIVPDNGPF